MLVVVAACLVTLSAGATLKTECTGPAASWRSQLCYNDIEPLYTLRGIDREVFPYLHARLTPAGVGSHGFNEYPVLTGLYMWLAGLPVSGQRAYLFVSMIGLAACALLSATLLARMAGLRALYFAAAPPLALYAFHNWDLLAVAAATVGLALWRGGRPREAAVAFGIGGAFKLYPVLFVVPLVLEQIARRRRGEAARVGGCGLGAMALANLPFALLGPSGWWATYRFHEQRPTGSSGTLWSNLDKGLSTGLVNLLGALLLGLAVVVISVIFVRSARAGRVQLFEWCAAVTAALLVLGKVSSPQYVLWVLPFFALVRTRPLWWATLCAVALVRYAGLFGVDQLGFGLATADHLVRIAVLTQAALLAAWAALLAWRMARTADP